MTNYSDIFFRQSRILRLDHFNDEKFDSFETATNGIIESFYNDLKLYAIKDEELEKKIAANYAISQTYETEEQSQLIDEQIDCERQSEYINAYLNSLLEMKILYLFKSLELTIKYFIKNAYPDVDARSLFKWENIKEFFRSKAIDISTLKGYSECVEIKKINNCIKHNGIVNEDIGSIPEFNGHSYINHEQLEIFYKRVNQNVKSFCYELKEKVKSDLYVFSSERLKFIAEDFYERMDDETMLEFIEKLKGRLK